MRTFEKEGRAYMWLIPEMQKVRAQRNLKPLAFPKCFYSSADDAILILENAKSLNYEVVEKKPERKVFKILYNFKNIKLGIRSHIHNT
jgi:Ecdysteroid kinase-like family